MGEELVSGHSAQRRDDEENAAVPGAGERQIGSPQAYISERPASARASSSHEARAIRDPSQDTQQSRKASTRAALVLTRRGKRRLVFSTAAHSRAAVASPTTEQARRLRSRWARVTWHCWSAAGSWFMLAYAAAGRVPGGRELNSDNDWGEADGQDVHLCADGRFRKASRGRRL
jgi:hypothetical protein